MGGIMTPVNAAESAREISERALADMRRDEATFRFAYRCGYATGHEVGYHWAHTEMDKAAAVQAAEIRGIARDIGLDERRWGPGGRAHFGDPRSGDYTGGPVAPW